MGDAFTLYVEIDQSCQFNDWFDAATPGESNYTAFDEPAVLYSVEIDLTDAPWADYTLAPIGWTTHVEYSDFWLSGASTGTTLAAGVFNNEMGYITHSKTGGVFGTEKLTSSSTALIDRIKAIVSDIP